ncbi:hypothetical protein ABT282_07520 [Streptomyces sp. NPDC000927]|uniref:hypothetical protein n=1 Tax=Streptomyces sp. NPDC000927 TaxID=3154371 RepID=UPI00332BF4A6
MTLSQEVSADTQKILDVNPDFLTLWHVIGLTGVSIGALALFVALLYLRAGSVRHRSMSTSTSMRSMR